MRDQFAELMPNHLGLSTTPGLAGARISDIGFLQSGTAAVCASLLPSVGLRARRAPGLALGLGLGLVAQLVRARA